MPQAWYSTCALSNAGARLVYSRQVAAVSCPSCPSQAPQPSGAVVRSSLARRHAPHPPPGQRTPSALPARPPALHQRALPATRATACAPMQPSFLVSRTSSYMLQTRAVLLMLLVLVVLFGCHAAFPIPTSSVRSVPPSQNYFLSASPSFYPWFHVISNLFCVRSCVLELFGCVSIN